MSQTRFRTPGVLPVAITVGLIACAADAGVIRVNAAAPSGGDGSTWATAFNDLQAALTAAQPGDEIWVQQGVYKPHPTNRAISFNLKNGVALYGGFTGVEESLLQRNPALTSTLSGEINSTATTDNTYNVVKATNVNASAILDGFLITAGQALGGAGFASAYGGGLFLDASLGNAPTIRGCTFSNNAAITGGGAIYIVGGTISIERCFFFGNRISGSTGTGGAIGLGVAVGANLTLINCVFAQNFTLSAAGGGAINANGGAVLNVYSSTFYNNSASSGSVLAGVPSTANFRNCIFNGTGGAAAYFAPAVNVQHSVVPGGMPGTGIVSAAATFVNAAAANFRLAAGSSGIDTGNNAAAATIATDFDFNPRVLNGTVDMGAYEFVAVTCAGDFNKDGVVDDSDFVLFAEAYNNLLDRRGDLNADLLSDDSDFVIFADAYNSLICP